MQKVTVTKVSWREVETSRGKAEKIGIQTSEHGNQWLSSFANKYNTEKLKAIKEGDTIEIKITKNGDYLNFALANATDKLEERVRRLEIAVGVKEEAADVAVVPVPDTDNW